MRNRLNRPAFSLLPFLVPALRSILFIAAGLSILLIPAFKGSSLSDTALWWPLLCIIVNIITIIVLIILTAREGKSFRDLINHVVSRQKTIKNLLVSVPLMLFLGTGGLVGISYLIYGYMPVTNSQPMPVWAAIIVLLLLPVTIMFAEIPLYLGYAAPRIKEITGNQLFSIIYPLFFYALQHCFMPLIFDLRYILSRFLMFIPLLVMMGIWYNRNRDLVPLMAGHGLLDLFTGIQLLLVSVDPSIYEMMKSASE